MCGDTGVPRWHVKYGNDARVEGGPAALETALRRGQNKLDALESELLATGVPDGNRAFNLTWHDWLNLRSLMEVSRVITAAALKRENSRGAHYREDFPGEGDLATSAFTVARQRDGKLEIADEPVRFDIVKPGHSLLKDAAE
jgi:fumarate reductase flavoprotein subunit